MAIGVINMRLIFLVLVILLLSLFKQSSSLSSSNNNNNVNRNRKSNIQQQLLQQQRALMLEGRPSSPGWKKGELDKLTDWAVSDVPNRPVICEYQPDALWLWSRWKGTVLSLTVIPVIIVMLISFGVDVAIHNLSTLPSWPILSIPPQNDPLVEQLQGINKLWEYQLTLSTFILTFFTSEAYNHWRTVYLTTRAIQGRINDICLLITIGAQRGLCTEDGCKDEYNIENPNSQQVNFNGGSINNNFYNEDLTAQSSSAATTTTAYSEAGSELVTLCTRLIRLSHTFFWAATPTMSNGVGDMDDVDSDEYPVPSYTSPRVNNNDGGDDNNSKEDTSATFCSSNVIGPILLSPEGLEELVVAGELTSDEKLALLNSGLPPSQYAYILLQWVGLHVMDGLESGVLRGSYGLEENILKQITDLRAQFFNIGDYTAGRMPLAYVQLVQVLVDSLVLLAPFALYPELGSPSIPLAGLLTLFFKGLLELSKSFLDPFGVEGYPGQNIRVDVLVSELNFGSASRWVKAGSAVPSSDVAKAIVNERLGIGTSTKTTTKDPFQP